MVSKFSKEYRGQWLLSAEYCNNYWVLDSAVLLYYAYREKEERELKVYRQALVIYLQVLNRLAAETLLMMPFVLPYKVSRMKLGKSASLGDEPMADVYEDVIYEVGRNILKS